MIVLGITFAAAAQSLSLSYLSGNIPNNSYVTVAGLPSDDMLESFVYVTNNSNASLDVKLKKIENYVTPNSVNLFCWGLCYPPNIYVSPDPIVIGPGQTNTIDFHGQYFPTETVGTTSVTYVFFDDNNPSDTVCFNVLYKTDGVPAITTVDPDSAQTGATTSFTITGENTHFGMGFNVSVKLTKGAEEIMASSVNVSGNTTVIAAFSLPAGTPTGAWDLAVENILDGCLVAEEAVAVYTLSGTGEITAGKISVYPNPATDFVYIDPGNTFEEDATLRLTGISGTQVLSANQGDDGIFVLRIKDLPRGIYFIAVEANGFMYTSKLIKAN